MTLALSTPPVWLGEDALCAPSSLHAPRNTARWQVEFLFPFVCEHRPSVPCDGTISRVVTRLLSRRGPAAIVGVIVAVVVDAIYRISIWLFAHVCEEGFEAVAPSFAHVDASSAVSSVVDIGWAVAPRYSVAPYRVRRSSTVRNIRGSMPVGDAVDLDELQHVAAATRAVATNQGISEHFLNSAAVAAACPPSRPIRTTEYEPAAEPMSSDVFADASDSLCSSQDDLLSVAAVRGASGVSAPTRPAIVSPSVAVRL